VHEVDEVRRRLSLFDDDVASRLLEYHLIEYVDYLKHHLIVFLLRYNQITEQHQTTRCNALGALPDGLLGRGQLKLAGPVPESNNPSRNDVCIDIIHFVKL